MTTVLDFTMGESAAELRGRLRRMVAEFFPADFLGAFTDDPADLAMTQQFSRKLAGEGLLTVAWPREFGGSDGSVWEQTVVREEMWAHHEPRGPQYMGLNWVGPAIMAYGTAEQKALHLPPIATGDAIWCQGFSEPESGSDLASLQTRATRVGDHWEITGQKIWTSYAGMAGWCVLAARTGPKDSGRRGISLFLIPMDREGITVRPVRAMLGPHHLNECFFDSVVATDGEMLGEVDAGWGVMRTALAHERVGIARYARCERLLWLLRDVLRHEWTDHDEGVRNDWASALVQVRVARLLAYRVVERQEGNQMVDLEASQARIAATTCDQQVAEVVSQLLGPRSLLGPAAGAPSHGAFEDHWRYAQAATVASGTIEIQREIVSRELLGRPAVG
ncbi:acyl-CoA dehydrogenase family protein [Acrocarpospora macrocephala]|uniref:acyl-CoA dehydrogenase family protein n=1 Tax=Acrocarpospora macrocephala TaxID=150177 RepID=UPI0012D2D1A7|nr:acyl-CoA dehydrogenase family protein [Acrocarpospora macrocephala]